MDTKELIERLENWVDNEDQLYASGKLMKEIIERLEEYERLSKLESDLVTFVAEHFG